MWALQRCSQTQDPDSPCDILGKSLLRGGLSFSICQMGMLDSTNRFQCLVSGEMREMETSHEFALKPDIFI